MLLQILTRTSVIEILQVMNDNIYQIDKINLGELLIKVAHHLTFTGSQCIK